MLKYLPTSPYRNIEYKPTIQPTIRYAKKQRGIAIRIKGVVIALFLCVCEYYNTNSKDVKSKRDTNGDFRQLFTNFYTSFEVSLFLRILFIVISILIEKLFLGELLMI